MREWAGIYVAMGRVGFSQGDVDDMELWVIAAHLEAHYPPGDGEMDGSDDGEGIAMTEDEFRRQSMAMIQQRLAEANATPNDPEPPTIPT